MVEDAPREDLEHFFVSLATSLGSTVHVKVLDGKNDHHKFEAAVKGMALAFRKAATPDPRRSEEAAFLQGRDVAMKFKVFNYGAGNLYSIQVALRREGVTPSLTRTGAGIEEADALVLPGVGSFDQAAKALPMERTPGGHRSGKPVLGICLGLQLFYSSSEEGSAKGLSLLRGRVRRFPSSVKVPQIGWNTLMVRREERSHGRGAGRLLGLLRQLVRPGRRPAESVAATSKYGVEYPALVAQKNIYGAQFHPEKSGAVGRRGPAELHPGGEEVATWNFGLRSTSWRAPP